MLQLITAGLLNELIEKARQSPRRRMNHNFHSGPEDNPHRFLNVFLHGSYLAPHRHLKPPKAEAFLVLEGWMAAILFDDAGNVQGRFLLGDGPPLSNAPAWVASLEPARGIDLAPGVWHTVAAISPHAVCYEVKPGPWDPSSDKEFAPWAPREGDPGAATYLESLLS